MRQEDLDAKLERYKEMVARSKRIEAGAKDVEKQATDRVECPKCTGPAFNKKNPGEYQCGVCQHRFKITKEG